MGKIFSFRDTSSEIEELEKKRMEDLREAVKYSQKEGARKPTVVIQFSWELIALILLILAIIFFGSQLISVLLFLFLGFVFTSAARPVVLWFMSKKISKGWAVLITYLIALIVVLALVSVVMVPLIGQVSELIKVLPTWVANLVSNFKEVSFGSINIDPSSLTQFVSNSFQNLSTGESFRNISNAVSGVFSTTGLLLSSFILSIYLVLEHDSILDFGLIQISSDEKRERVKKLVLDVERKLGKWLLGQATISLMMGIFSGILLTILKVPFALPLAVMIALFDAIPSIGATIALVITALVILATVNPLSAAIFAGLFIIYQQLENNFIVPKIMGNAIGLKPVVIMLGAFVFLILFGIFGALIAVPFMVILQIFYEFYIDLQKLKAKGIV
jgi:predicted PurR-regulated permease PerM